MTVSRTAYCAASTATLLVACSQLVDLSDLAGPSPLVEDAGGNEAASPLDSALPFDAADAPDTDDAAPDADAGASLDDGLVAYFPLDEGSGTTITDVSPTHLTGALVGAPSWVDGKFGKALEFDGAGSYVDTLPSSAFEFGVSSFSVAAWVRLATVDASVPSTFTLVSHGVVGTCCQDAGYPGFLLGSLTSTLQVRIEDEAEGLNTILAGGTIPPPGLWVHLVGVRSESKLSYFVNGVRRADKPVPAGYSVSGSGYSLMLGASPGFPTGRFLAGTLDEVRIYARALSDAEVAALFAYVP